MRDRRVKTYRTVSARKPATCGSSATGMSRVAEFVSRTIGEGSKWLHEGAERDRPLGIVPTGSDHHARLAVEQKIRNIVAGEFLVQGRGGGLDEERGCRDGRPIRGKTLAACAGGALEGQQTYHKRQSELSYCDHS